MRKKREKETNVCSSGKHVGSYKKIGEIITHMGFGFDVVFFFFLSLAYFAKMGFGFG